MRTGALQLSIECSRRFVQEVGFVCLAEWVVGVLCVSFTSGEFGEGKLFGAECIL